MAEVLRMPEVSANMESALLASWMVVEGETFDARHVIAVIETEKAVVDFEAEFGGTIVRKLVQDGAEVSVGAPIAVVAAIGETVTDVDAVISALDATAGVTPTQLPRPAVPFTAPEIAEQAVEAVVDVNREAGVFPVKGNEPSPGRRFSSPLARKLARAAGLDLGTIAGTGPNGRVVRRDVQAALATGPGAPGQRPDSVAGPSLPPPSSAVIEPFTDIPHTRLRKAIAARLTESKATAPHFYVRGSAEVSALLRMREEINEGAAIRVSVNDVLIKAIGKAHQIVPDLNVIWMQDAVRRSSSVDVSVAIATPGGLVTPVVRGVDHLSLTAVAVAVRDFVERGRSGRLQQSELEGGTVSISNLGMYGTQEFAAIINPPQASILAVGAAREEPVVRDGSLVVGTVLRYTLSVDHRPVDGVAAAEWVRVFTDLLEHPAKILA